MKPKIVIERMTSETVTDVSRLELQCFSTPWSLSALTVELENPLAVFHTASVGGEIAGYAGMYNVAGEGYITNIAVSPSFRRLGVARGLIENLLEYGVKKGLMLITLEVRGGNEAARSLYQGFGFNAVGIRKSFYTNPDEDAIIMTRIFKEKFI